MNHIEILSLSGSCFRLLSACFYEPDKDLFLEQQACHNLSHLLNSFSPKAAECAQKMDEEMTRQDQQQLSIDYSALFIGPFDLLAPPYGSVYLEKKREVMGETTINVLKFYQDAGLQVEASEPADHIAIELEFMSFLHDKETSALQEGTNDEADHYSDLRKKFFSSCLDPWVSEFCNTICNGTDNSFYQHLAKCLSAYIVAYRQQVMETVASI